MNLVILGSTGSIGTQALDIVRRNPGKYRVVGLSAHSNLALLKRQAEEFRPDYVGFSGAERGTETFSGAKVLYGGQALAELSALPEADAVLYATVGFAGVAAVIAGIECGKRILLANKETLVCAGQIIMPLAERRGVTIFPVDSEHSAIFQCLEGKRREDVNRLVITGSGGAFRDMPIEELSRVTAEQALRHPNWSMGKKITVDCATMVNKALEVIEAKWLFGVDFDRIHTVLHRESVIHSMVEFRDGTTMAQMSYPTMEIPISLALSYPERWGTTVPSLDFVKLGKLSFGEISEDRYPCYFTVLNAGKKGGILPAAVSGANEVFVAEFLAGRLVYSKIAEGLERVSAAFSGGMATELSDVVRADKEARAFARSLIFE